MCVTLPRHGRLANSWQLAARRSRPAARTTAAASQRHGRLVGEGNAAAVSATPPRMRSAHPAPPRARSLAQRAGAEHLFACDRIDCGDGDRRSDTGGQPDRRLGRPRAQPQGHLAVAAARRAGRDHRAVRVGQVEPRVRHDLRRGPAPLRRVAVGLRAPVPRPDGQARRGLDRGALAGDLDRPEDDLAQPALDGRHGDRDLRLPAPAVGARGQAALPDLRAADRRPVGRADRRPGDGARRRARASWCSRRSCAGARASTASCSRSCARTASRA